MSLLVTGFGPFLEVSDNPSGRIAEALADRVIGGHGVAGYVLPTTFGGAREAIARLVDRHAPRAALALGVARARRGYQLELRARGGVASASPDALGDVWRGRVLAGGARENPVPLAAIASELAADGHDVATSDEAGGYVCDATYQALLVAADRAPPIPVAFMHVPDDLSEAALAAGVHLAKAVLEKLLARAMVPPA